jgi:hypothetical protein
MSYAQIRMGNIQMKEKENAPRQLFQCIINNNFDLTPLYSKLMKSPKILCILFAKKVFCKRDLKVPDEDILIQSLTFWT